MADVDAEHVEKMRRWNRIAMGATLVMLLLVAVPLLLKSSDNPAYQLGSVLGGFIAALAVSMFLAALCALILLVFRKKFSLSFLRCYTIFAVLMPALSMVSSVAAPAVSTKKKAAVWRATPQVQASLVQDKQTMLNLLQASDMPSSRLDFRFETNLDPKVRGNPIRIFARKYFNLLIASSQEYFADLEKIGWEKAMDPSRVAKDTDFTETREMCRQAMEACEAHFTRVDEAAEACPGFLKEGGLDPVHDKLIFDSILKGFRKGLGSETNRRAKELELNVLQRIGESLEFLHATRERWEVEEDTFVFDTDEDLAAYQSILEKLQSAIEEQQKAHAELQ